MVSFGGCTFSGVRDFLILTRGNIMGQSKVKVTK